MGRLSQRVATERMLEASCERAASGRRDFVEYKFDVAPEGGTGLDSVFPT